MTPVTLSGLFTKTPLFQAGAVVEVGLAAVLADVDGEAVTVGEEVALAVVDVGAGDGETLGLTIAEVDGVGAAVELEGAVLVVADADGLTVTIGAGEDTGLLLAVTVGDGLGLGNFFNGRGRRTVRARCRSARGPK